MTHFLMSASSLMMSSVEILLLSWRKRGENFPSMSRLPWASLNTCLETQTGLQCLPHTSNILFTLSNKVKGVQAHVMQTHYLYCNMYCISGTQSWGNPEQPISQIYFNKFRRIRKVKYSDSSVFSLLMLVSFNAAALGQFQRSIQTDLFLHHIYSCLTWQPRQTASCTGPSVGTSAWQL